MNGACPPLNMIRLSCGLTFAPSVRVLFRTTTAITVLSFFVFCFSDVANARADRLDEIRQRGTLVWGADKDGGAPYISLDKDDPTKLVGFEVELAQMLAKELGVKAEFQHGEWENLPTLLDSRKIDIVINGYELDAERQASYRCSRPYYVYGLQLLVSHDSSIQFWKDMRSKVEPIRKVGVLGGSAADRFFRDKETDLDKWSQYVEVIKYTGSIECLNDVKAGRLDATLRHIMSAEF